MSHLAPPPTATSVTMPMTIIPTPGEDFNNIGLLMTTGPSAAYSNSLTVDIRQVENISPPLVTPLPVVQKRTSSQLTSTDGLLAATSAPLQVPTSTIQLTSPEPVDLLSP